MISTLVEGKDQLTRLKDKIQLPVVSMKHTMWSNIPTD